MTRKDYERIAAAIREAHEDITRSYGDRWDVMHEAIDSATALIADELADDNPRFDRERFLAAAREEQS